MHRTISLVFGFFFISCFCLTAQPIHFTSPDGKLKLTLETGEETRLSFFYQEKPVLLPSDIGMELAGLPTWGKNTKTPKVTTNTARQTLKPLWGKRKEIDDHYKQWLVDFGVYAFEVRMYNHGAAYRWVGKLKNKEVLVTNELARYHFAANDTMYFPTDNTFENSFEKQYEVKPIQSAKRGDYAFLPILIKRSDGLKVAITDSDVRNYPAMHLKRMAEDSLRPVLQGFFARYPQHVEKGGYHDFNLKVKERENYIAKTSGTRSFPWRLFVVTPDDGFLPNNDLVYQLAEPQVAGDFSWVKPGKAVWDWWADWNLSGVDFKAGFNTATYKHYIDFAAEAKAQYVILDEGWSDAQDLFKINPNLDLDELIRYGKTKNVQLILWCVWHTLLNQMEPFMQQCNQKGIAGLKVDFFDRDDQPAMEALETMAEAAARNRLTLDFHGVSKPTGLHRKYPNILNYEGVLGNEWNKWSDQVTPTHTIQIPFIRMLAGPMDFTPGGMRNTHYQGKDFPKMNSSPYVMGTRCRQLAMYVLYEGGLQMLSDLPSEYRKEPVVLEFLKTVPPTWDDTKVLQAEVGNHLFLARKSGTSWFVGGMNDNNPLEATLNFGFLESGKKYTASVWADGLNAGKSPEDLRFTKTTIKQGDSLKFQLEKAGGLVLKLDLAE
jgi:alpha-glucosidase